MASIESLGAALKKLGYDVTLTPAERELALAEREFWPRGEVTPECARWCHGYGYRRTGSTLIEGASGELRALAEVLDGLTYEFCGCSTGQEARGKHRAARAELERRRAQQAADRIWAEARLEGKQRGYTLASYLALPEARTDLVELLRRWQQTDRWLLLYGPAGTCKTGLAVALLLEALGAGLSGMYVVTPDFLDRIRLTYRQDGADAVDETDVLASVAAVDVLVLDDVGKAPLSAWGREKLFTLLNRRDIAERRTILTTNLGLGELEDHLGVQGATYDRIRGNAVDRATGESYVLELGGPSRRGATS